MKLIKRWILRQKIEECKSTIWHLQHNCVECIPLEEFRNHTNHRWADNRIAQVKERLYELENNLLGV